MDKNVIAAMMKMADHLNVLTGNMNKMTSTMDVTMKNIEDMLVLLEAQDKRIKQISDREAAIETIMASVLASEGKGIILQS